MLYKSSKITQIQINVGTALSAVPAIDIQDSFEQDQKITYRARWNWSDSQSKSAWLPIDQAISNINSLLTLREQTILLELQISVSEAIPYTLTSIAIGDDVIDKTKLAIRNTTEWRYAVSVLEHTETFKPYAGQEGMIELQNTMVDDILRMFGHNFIWFKVATDAVNETFKSIEELSVHSVKELKVLVPDNDFKDNALVYSEWGVEYDESLELHIPLEEFERKFGPGMRPQAFDYFVIPELNRIYEVTSSHAKREFMHQAVYYTVTAKKYKHRPDIDRTNETKTIFDIDTIRDFNVDGLQALALSTTATAITGDIITDAFDESIQAASEHLYLDLRLNDYLRTGIHKNVNRLSTKLCNGSMAFSNAQYDVSKVFDEPAVLYKNRYTDTQLSRTLQFWLKPTAIESGKILVTDKLTIEIIANVDSLTLALSWDVEGENQPITTIAIDAESWWNIIIEQNLETRTIALSASKLGNSTSWGKPQITDTTEATSEINLDYNLTGSGQNILWGWKGLITNVRFYTTQLDQTSRIKNIFTPQAPTTSSIIIDNIPVWSK